MKFTLSWLKDWLDTDAYPAAIAETLTNIGLEVEGLTKIYPVRGQKEDFAAVSDVSFAIPRGQTVAIVG